jgi:DNA polymerase
VATNDVPGEGNPEPEVLFVGEGPGKDEDEQGRPFVGAAGKFLTELIESIGWKREDVYIANLIKHRPPDNRDPLPQEIDEYAPWLDKQIEIISPKLIVTLGRYSMAYFLGDQKLSGGLRATSGGLSITEIHGQPKRNSRGQVVMPMYHPAAALYRGDLRPVLMDDWQKIIKVLELIDKDEPITQEEEKDTKEEKEAEEEQAQATLF